MVVFMKICIVIIGLVIFTALFRSAAGTLSLKKINIISFSYYSILGYSFIGASLVFLGFREHYLIQKVTSEAVINKTYAILMYTIICLPIWIIVFNKIFKQRSIQKRYEEYVKKKVECIRDNRNTFVIMVFLTFLGIAATAYVFKCIGYIPLLKMFETGFDSATARIEIGRNFEGNSYIKNLVVSLLTPLLSYISYIYFRSTKKAKWFVLFSIQAILCVFIKTYDFSKSPILYYLIGFYLIETALGTVKSLKPIVFLGILVGGIIFVQYGGINGVSNYLTIYSGPIGRILMTQIATLFLHVQAFPGQVDFLDGASLPTILARVIGSPSSWERSGRVVMELYNPAGVKAGTAGVMNTIFVGEAYANWGYVGVLIAPIIVAFVLSAVFNYAVSAPKNPFNLTLYLALFQTLTSSLQGGFVDFLYSSSVIVMIIFIKGIAFLGSGKVRVKTTYDHYGRKVLDSNLERN